MKHLLVLAILLAACKDKAPPAPAPAPSPRAEACSSALASFDRFVDTGDPSTPEQRAQIRAALLDRCATDHWSETAITCMKTAGTSHDVMKCWSDHLTQEQRDAASKALGSVPQ